MNQTVTHVTGMIPELWFMPDCEGAGMAQWCERSPPTNVARV